MARKSSTLIRILSGSALALMLAACAATPTPFQAATADGGYTDRKVESGRYQVTFTGNGATPKKAVEEAALFRAAQVTLKGDHDYFKVVSNKVELAPDSPGGGGGFMSSIFGGGGGDESHVSTLDIAVFEGEKPDDDQNTYKARDVIKQLKDSVLAERQPNIANNNGSIANDLRKPSTRNY